MTSKVDDKKDKPVSHTEAERRNNYPRPEKELYRVKDVNAFIENERRHDELDRIIEAQEQKRTWQRTMVFCGLLNLTLIILAIVGMYK